jgi:CMP-N-acetylneuraminic acid synthetase
MQFLLPGVKYLKRDEQFDTPQANVIEMMRVFSEKIDADVYVQAHATTPFLTSESIDQALEEIQNGEYDSSFAVTKLQVFLWQKGKPVNYNPETIPRTQDMEPYFKETTGLYIFKKQVIQDMHRRIGVNPYLLEVSEIESLDIDEPEDFMIANAVYTYLKENNYTEWI